MRKMRLNPEQLTVESFSTTAAVRGKGTVFAEQCTCPTACTCPGCATCDGTCPETCPYTCDGSCAATCGCQSDIKFTMCSCDCQEW